MLDMIRGLSKASKIRTILFILVVIWAMYCFLAYSVDVRNGAGLSDQYIDVTEIKDINVDGSDFTWLGVLLGAGVNGMLTFAICIILLFIVVAEAIFVLIPVLLLRFIGLRKKWVDTVSIDEYKIAKYIYVFAIGLSVFLGLIVTKFQAIIPMMILDAVWILLMLIYVLGLKNTLKMKELLGGKNE